MKYIKKNKQPQKFTDWMALKNDDWQPTYEKLSGDVKKSVCQSLLNEQGHICCYCERALAENDYHIEHLNPQAAREGDNLIYENLLLSCLKDTAKGDPLHCGKLKENVIIEVHPLQEDCSSKFSFTASGEIYGNDESARSTIQILGLDIKKLVDMRNEVLTPFLDESLEPSEFIKFVVGYLSKSDAGRLNPFYSMIRSLFDPNGQLESRLGNLVA